MIQPDNKAYKTVFVGGSSEIIIKKSRFIATISPIASEEAAEDYIDQIKKKNWNASHNCHAYILGTGNPLMRFSDDGEPNQTAGKPMLDILMTHGLTDVIAVVTRYFGGTLLGTGGLVKAYQSAVIECLKLCQIITKELGILYQITTDYTYIGKLQYYINQDKLPLLSTQYTDNILITLVIPFDMAETFRKTIFDLTHGSAGILEKEQVYFTVIDNEVHLFT